MSKLMWPQKSKNSFMSWYRGEIFSKLLLFLCNCRGSFLVRSRWNKARQGMKTLPCFVRISSGNKGNRLPRTHNQDPQIIIILHPFSLKNQSSLKIQISLFGCYFFCARVQNGPQVLTPQIIYFLHFPFPLSFKFLNFFPLSYLCQSCSVQNLDLNVQF